MSHKQSAVKRGFNINKHTLVDNLEDATLTSLRSVYGEIIHHGSIISLPINKSLLLSCNSAGTRYKNDLEQRREESVNNENNQKQKQLNEELSVVKREKVEMEDRVKELDADADKFVSEAGITDDMMKMKKISYEGEFFKQSVKEKKKQNHELEATIEMMEMELRFYNK